MKNILICLFILSSNLLSGQQIDYPFYQRKSESSIELISIQITNSNTIIKFMHTAPSYYKNGGWVNLHRNIYLKDENEIKYHLIRTEGIPLEPNKHEYSYVGEKLYFTAYFNKLPSSVSRIDIIECADSDDCFNFYGVSLVKTANQNENNSKISKIDRFRRDYEYVSLYDPSIKTWSDWQEGTNTVVFNVNNNGDIRIYYASGKNEVLRKVTDVESDYTPSGEKYQITGVLNYEGEQIILQLFDSGNLKLIYPSGFMVQFSQ